MPLTKSAIKKDCQDAARRLLNKTRKSQLKEALKAVEIKVSPETVQKAYSALDKGVKYGILAKNKASRKKSSLAKRLAGTKKSSATAKSKKTAEKSSH